MESPPKNVINIWNDEIPYDNGEKAEMTIFLPKEKNLQVVQ